ncbi:MlaE family ABC transporter permease [Candidatus Palauibacter sp.]|uniref:MlaE family ABC transporter permease n=1 Tax=Candidatus Palauibacter sp. TaxID=3101350 RepID=UPI003AF30579
MKTPDLFAASGRSARTAALHAGRVGLLGWATLRSLARPRAYALETVAHAKQIGVDSLPLVLLMGALSGAVMAQQTMYQLSQGLPREIVAGGVVGGMLTELGPVLTAVVLAGRVGAGIGAELGTMKVTNQIDALLTMGRDPVLELVVPRVVAGTVILVPLVLLADAMGIFSGYVTSVTILGLTSGEYVEGAKGYYHHGALIFSLVKAVAYGFAITFTASYVGLRARGGAAGVGRTATRAVVAIIVSIMVLDTVLGPVYKALT